MEHEIRDECRTWRESIERRMGKAESVGESVSGEVSEHRSDINVLKSNMEHLTKSIQGQTKAIWGLVVMVLGVLGTFFIWYIQSLPR
jgi:hypothetical protein